MRERRATRSRARVRGEQRGKDEIERAPIELRRSVGAALVVVLLCAGHALAVGTVNWTMSQQTGGSGSVTVLRPDGTPLPGSPFTGGGLPGPWAVAVDGNDNVWVSNFAMPSSPIVQLCGVRTENMSGFSIPDRCRGLLRRVEIRSPA